MTVLTMLLSPLLSTCGRSELSGTQPLSPTDQMSGAVSPWVGYGPWAHSIACQLKPWSPGPYCACSHSPVSQMGCRSQPWPCSGLGPALALTGSDPPVPVYARWGPLSQSHACQVRPLALALALAPDPALALALGKIWPMCQ